MTNDAKDQGKSKELTITQEISEESKAIDKVITHKREDIVELSRTLSHAQEKLLAVLIDPAHFDKLNTEKAELAGVSKTTFYAYLRDDDFTAVLQECCKAMLNSNLAPIFDAMNKTASKEGREGTQDRKLALEVGGIIEGKGGGVTIQQNFSIGQLMDEIDGQTAGLPTPNTTEEKDTTK